MIDFIKELFKEHNFDEPVVDNELYFFKKTEENIVEYYLVVFVDVTKLNRYLESDGFDVLLNFFNGQKKQSEDVEKNTSLLLFAKVDDLSQGSHNLFERHIWRIEEDEYFFNKNVILYDESSAAKFDQSNSLNEQLGLKVSDKEKFDEFLNNNFNDPNYYFCIQLFIKIPFLEPPVFSEEFTDLQSTIDNKLNDHQQFLANLLGNSISDDFPDTKESFLNTSNESVDEFLKKFSNDHEVD